MLILGVFTGKDSGVALIDKGNTVYAANEERFCREKMFTGFPSAALENMVSFTGVRKTDIDAIAFGGRGRPAEYETLGYESGKVDLLRKGIGAFSRKFGWFMETDLAYKVFTAYQSLSSGRSAVLSDLRSNGMKAPVQFIEHHFAHAYSGYYSAGFGDCMVITSDGGGDGISGAVHLGRNGQLKRVGYSPRIHSAGNFWAYITILLGMDPWRHGGKVTGLAAYEPSEEAYNVLRKFYGYSERKMHFLNHAKLFLDAAMEHLREVMKPFNKAQIAYAAQRVLEENVTGSIKAALKRFGSQPVVLAGGTFANVKLNQRIFELEEAGVGFVHPHMGDGGIAFGSAYAAWATREPARAAEWIGKADAMASPYLGPNYPERDIKEALDRNGFRYHFHETGIEQEAARLLNENKVVAHFAGRMEYGPRALGNRSIFYSAKDHAVNDWLNKQLNRSEFMPFAPIVTADAADRYFMDLGRMGRSARFMTVTCDCTKLMKERGAAAVHVDGTARPQTVREADNPRVYNILARYGELSGDPVLVNTSFNMHEEPIVNSPEDALRAFTLGNLDALVMERFLITKEENEGRFNQSAL